MIIVVEKLIKNILKSKKAKILFLFFAVLTVTSVFTLEALSTSQQETITVGGTVPAAVCGNALVDIGEDCDDGILNGSACPNDCNADCTLKTCPGGGDTPPPPPPADNPPVINNVVVTPAKNSVKITWSASDDHGVSTTIFVYGLTDAYGSSGNVGGGYEVNLAGLNVNTTYYYRITVTDTINQSVFNAGNFKTLSDVDNVPPVISNVTAVPAITSATITWDTDEVADSQVNFGLTSQYGSTALDNASVTQHSVVVPGLLPNTTYHFRVISTDASANSAQSVDGTFKTNKDNVPPPDVNGLQLTVNQSSISLSWNNPSLLNVPDFLGIKIVRKVGASSANVNDGLLVYTSKLENFTDQNAQANVDYYYTLFSYDTSGNYSGGVFKNGKITPQAPPPPPAEICDNNLDDDNDGFIDCADLDCATNISCVVPPGPGGGAQPELCDNGLDDDGDGRVDCADADCGGFPVCAGPALPGGATVRTACADGLDNDGDGLVDFPNDPGCVDEADNEEYNPPPSSVPEFAKIDLSGLLFLAGNRQIKLSVGQGKTVAGLFGSAFTVGVPKKILAGPPISILLKIDGGSTPQFVYNPVAEIYFSDISFPSAGPHQSFLEVDYGNNQFDTVEFELQSAGLGEVRGKDNMHLEGVEIILLAAGGNKVDVSLYGETNPVITDQNGTYGWMAPNGQYFIETKKAGYYGRKIPVEVKNNLVNLVFSLIPKPPLIEIDPQVSVLKNVKSITKNLTLQAGAISQVTVERVADTIKNPEVKKTASQVVAPTAIGIVAVSAVSVVSWSNLLSLLQFLFLQPLLLLGKKKREKWGQVYNSLNKLPIDLAMVRLVDQSTGRIVQSRVTDAQGRYIFSAKPGKYKIAVTKDGLVFPSALLKEFKTDGTRADIYHGEAIEVSEENAMVAVNIPIDPVGATAGPRRLAVQKFLRRLQVFLSWAGLIVTAISFYISRQWYVGVLLVAHLFLFFVFKRLAVSKKPKGWGIVYDVASRRPIARVIARLFDSQFNKLVATQVTDSRGRYYFLAGENKYYMTYSHAAYEEHKTGVIDMAGKKESMIAVNVPLKRAGKTHA